MVDSFQNDTELVQTAPRPVRKKFAKSPVKVACLPCRASRTRCGGQEPCSNCVAKGRKCSYLPSKRGGPRKKKQKALPSPGGRLQQDNAKYAMVPSTEFKERMQARSDAIAVHVTNDPKAPDMFSQIDVLSLPGAGLRHLDFPQSSLIQGYYSGDGSSRLVHVEPMPSPMGDTQSWVRTYGSEPEILNAYYHFIHTYFPILPPRASPPCRDRPLQRPVSGSNSSSEPVLMYRPRSSLSLAISAILALIPHPNDPEPSSPASIVQRRTYARTFAQLANTIVESECDLEISSTDTGRALSSRRPSVPRERLHPRTPQDLETLLSLLILSVYEYSQRGNLLKMKYRASQALSLALDKSLHAYMQNDQFCEARRRAWWMTYYCVIQGSIVSPTPPAIVIDDPQFTTPYPRFSSDAEGWSILIQAQQVLVSATQFIADLNKCFASQSGMHYMFERMQQLDSWANSVLARAEILPIISREPDFGDRQETITAQAIRAISRIKLSSASIKTHRFRAFSNIPIFIKPHCGLTAANHAPSDLSNKPPVPGTSSLSCSCSNPDTFQRASSTEYMIRSDSFTSSAIGPYIPQYLQHPFASGFPYCRQYSAKVCLRAALVISRMFESLPFPQPLPANHQQQQQQQQSRPLPRTMPSFACCLMQSSYAMFMILCEVRVAKQLSPDPENDPGPGSTDQLVEELRQGLERIIAALSNYSLASEALDGMRDEIQGAYQRTFPVPV